MPKADHQWQKEAREAAERIERQRDMGHQLTFLPDERPEGVPGEAEQVDAPQQIGRPKGAKNKGSSQLREWLASKGCRMPEDVVAEVAGLRSRDDAITLAMERTERILAWAYDGAAKVKGSPDKATPTQRLSVFEGQYATILRAAEAILPYVAAKAAGNEDSRPPVFVVMPGAQSAPADPAASARNVTPQPARNPNWMMPADVAAENERKQQLSETENGNSDAENRTDEASD
ncbi:hypothetical protein [Roseovarius indicus]|uniref:Uncharacterized protein n=1 Tax=Roseovarius indicus TaxID=540747 RepID=A0A0T5P3F0_9RHOB|nr:hypothetical protein [Roseovarius indicus]KRS15648.1 hypothetical protein XM52_22680 [Roseovarius indicus]QEW27842.1 hypothetical protein RIdsm_03663 [Roseovarius indicus]SFE79406.1 hypothetical protein SAMN04488031_12224 [Roseovarius indicus]